ncbi:MAG: ribonuclease H-like domain-containing protein [Thaumarchaeota archaeon]|nr:ribonuclease H-like domain-containing protein [Nitrososphaerota archaeon]
MQRHKPKGSPIVHPEKQRFIYPPDGPIGFFDIETTNLKANFAIMLSWFIKLRGRNEFFSDVIALEDLRAGRRDRRIVETLVNTLELFRSGKLVTFYGSRFDVPFSRSRALKYHLPFPRYPQTKEERVNSIRHTDLYYTARNKLLIHSNRLSAVAEFLGIEGKTPVSATTWEEAVFAEDAKLKKALGWIYQHNKDDVIVLEKVFNRLEPFIAPARRFL